MKLSSCGKFKFDRTNAPLRLPLTFLPEPLARCFVFSFPVILALSCMLSFEARFGPSRNQADGFWVVPQTVTCWEVAPSERSDAQFHFGHVWTKNGNCCSAGSDMIRFPRNCRVCVWTCHISTQYYIPSFSSAPQPELWRQISPKGALI